MSPQGQHNTRKTKVIAITREEYNRRMRVKDAAMLRLIGATCCAALLLLLVTRLT